MATAFEHLLAEGILKYIWILPRDPWNGLKEPVTLRLHKTVDCLVVKRAHTVFAFKLLLCGMVQNILHPRDPLLPQLIFNHFVAR